RWKRRCTTSTRRTSRDTGSATPRASSWRWKRSARSRRSRKSGSDPILSFPLLLRARQLLEQRARAPVLQQHADPALERVAERHYMVEVAHRAHIEEQRRLALYPHSARGKHGALDAVRASGAQNRAHRAAGVAADFEVLP